MITSLLLLFQRVARLCGAFVGDPQHRAGGVTIYSKCPVSFHLWVLSGLNDQRFSNSPTDRSVYAAGQPL